MKVKITKRYLRQVHAATLEAAEAFRIDAPFLAAQLSPNKAPANGTELASLIGKVRAVSWLLKLKPVEQKSVANTFTNLMQLLRIEETA